MLHKIFCSINSCVYVEFAGRVVRGEFRSAHPNKRQIGRKGLRGYSIMSFLPNECLSESCKFFFVSPESLSETVEQVSEQTSSQRSRGEITSFFHMTTCFPRCRALMQSMDVRGSSVVSSEDLGYLNPWKNNSSRSRRRRGRRGACRVACSVLLLTAYAACRCCALSVTDFSSSAKKRDTLLSVRLWASQEASGETPCECCFPHQKSPYLAIITQPDACDSEVRMEATIQAISSAVSTGKVALVSIRIAQPQHVAKADDFEDRVVDLTTRLVALTEEHSFRVVVTSDWVPAAVRALAHGIHVKERDRSRIPDIRKQFAPRIPLIGTSSHSVESALETSSLYQPDYLFVGTCYATASHPGKIKLEGPALPGSVCRALPGPIRPVVLAIGGINKHNCHEPVVLHGADGVAVIRSVLQSSDPGRISELIHRNMRETDVADRK